MKTNRTTPAKSHPLLRALAVACGLLAPLAELPAATFPGNAHLQVNDPSGGLFATDMTVQCWFKISVPSGTVPTENMSILINRCRDETAPCAYHLLFDVTNGYVQFAMRGATTLWTNMLIPRERFYLDRWYHVAMTRTGRVNATVTLYLDGQLVTNATANVGDLFTTNGVSVGGYANGHFLMGEVQEVSIYPYKLEDYQIRDYMFKDQREFDALLPTNKQMRGYFKLGYSTNAVDGYANFADVANQPTGTAEAVKMGSGPVLCEETDRKGEQSLFDSQVSGGKNAIVPLSGAFTWQKTLFSRPVPGIPFDFTIAYSPQGGGALGPGWNHSFETKLAKISDLALQVRHWGGGIDTWDASAYNPGVPFGTREGEYRGELSLDSSFNVLWTNAQREVREFISPTAAGITKGCLRSVRDFNGNVMTSVWSAVWSNRLDEVVDAAGGHYALHYDSGSRLTNLQFGAWRVGFSYAAISNATRLTGVTIANTNRGLYADTSNTWRFHYNTNVSPLLARIVDPRGNTNVIVSYDDYGRKTNVVDVLGHATRTAYGAPGNRQVTTTDAEGFKWIETCDRKGRVTSRQDPLGNVTRYAYDERGNRVSSTDPLGNTTLSGYDERGNRLAQTNALGEVTRWTYHTNFNAPIAVVDPLGWTTHYDLDDATGNLLAEWDGLGAKAAYTYTSNGLVQTETDANGHVTGYAYDTNGFLAARTDAGGNTERYAHNDLGWRLAVTNPLDAVTRYQYDENGNVVRTEEPLNRVYTGTYDANGNQLSKTDPKGQSIDYAYDALNRKIMEVDRAGATSRVAYTVRGKPSATTNPLGRVTTFHYDAANRETNKVDAIGQAVGTVFDANGNSVMMMDTLGRRWTRVYDRLNRVVAQSDPFGNTSYTVYDAAGRVRETVAPDGGRTTHGYDGRGRLVARTNAAGAVWRYAYDGVGNITNVTDARDGHYAMAYGPRNERIRERNQDGKEWVYTYDELNRLGTQTEPNGTERTVKYDAGGRVLSVSFNTGRVNAFLYDENDNPVVMSRHGGPGPGPVTITRLDYDAQDRVREVRDIFNKAVRYAYDAAGRLTTLTYPDGKTLTQDYDALDRLTGQIFQFGAAKTFTNTYVYDAASRLVRRTYPNGVVQTNGFDAAGRVTALSHAGPAPVSEPLAVALRYAYDRSGNFVSADEQGVLPWDMPALRAETSRYTAAARLLDRQIAVRGSTNPLPSSLSYAYDDSGNMTNAVGTNVYGYNECWTLGYDEDNRTVAIDWDPYLTGKSITNRYDALGRRVARTVDHIQTGFVLDLVCGMERILCDLDAAGEITAWYVHGADLSFKVEPDGRLACFHSDAQGNVIALTDAQGDTSARYAYTPYGRSLGSMVYATNGVTNAYCFAGSQGVMEDVVPGLYFMRARYYFAEAGVFLSTDPVRNIGPTWTPVAYAYAAANPLRFSDPAGEFWNLIAAAAGAVVGAAVGAVVDITVQAISGEEIDWGHVAGAAAAGALTGAIGGLTMGASLAVQAVAGAVVGMAAVVVAQGVENAAEGQGFFEGLSASEVLMGGIMGGLGPLGGKVMGSLGRKAGSLAKGAEGAFEKALAAMTTKDVLKQVFKDIGEDVVLGELKSGASSLVAGAGTVAWQRRTEWWPF